MNHTCHHGGLYKEVSSKVEADIANNGKYIPLGWQRKVYCRRIRCSRSNKSHYRYKVAYISPFGTVLYSNKAASEHIEYLKKNGITLSVNVDELDFSTDGMPKRKKKGICWEEVEVDNKDKYVPDGWQRKLFRTITGKCKGKYSIAYTSPWNKDVFYKKDMIKYLVSVEKQGYPMFVNVDQLDFHTPSHVHRKSIFQVDATVEMELESKHTLWVVT